jgi:hypothetical protein
MRIQNIDTVQKTAKRHFFRNLFQVPDWTDEFEVAMKTADPSAVRESWKLTDGFVASEGRDILPHLSRSRLGRYGNLRSVFFCPDCQAHLCHVGSVMDPKLLFVGSGFGINSGSGFKFGILKKIVCTLFFLETQDNQNLVIFLKARGYYLLLKSVPASLMLRNYYLVTKIYLYRDPKFKLRIRIRTCK